ncbi:mannose-1-phosphate guanylyltransferase [Nibricoccus sp. IMCC34717]|uniref:mannose-1-phosphate guanylyltransferase n=1 Tax=Nibricoccus sp. IMCC34717 TaxID=3034021 RepID=UPI00384FF98C
MSHLFVVIIAGGRGERFWPQSRAQRPKHLLPIVGDKPLLTQTVERVSPVVPRENILVITSAIQEHAVREVCAALPAENIVVEPIGRDTAPAVALACALVEARDPKGIFAVLPADHVIHDSAAYQNDLRAAFSAAQAAPVMVTIGIHPNEPATGFGYIQRGERWKELQTSPVYHVSRFVEKPNLETAQAYLRSGDYMWNAGMFIWSVAVVQQALTLHAPALAEGMKPVRDALAKGLPLAPVLAATYPGLTKISVDYALLEKAERVVVMPASFDWDDVGAWPAVARHAEADPSRNVCRGLAVVEQGSDNIVYSTADHLCAVVGADNLIVVHTPDATLVVPKDRAQDIKALLKRVEALKDGSRWL